MPPAIMFALLAVTPVATELSQGKQSCDEVAQVLTRALQMAQLQMEPEGTLRRVYTEAIDSEAPPLRRGSRSRRNGQPSVSNDINSHSPAVRELLDHPTPELRRALRAHERSAKDP